MPLIRKTQAAPASALSGSGVLDALRSGSADERWAAARAAPETAGGIRALADALPHEPNPRVREAMLTSLVRVSTPECVELIIPLVRSDNASLRTGALDALRAMKQVVWAYVPQLLFDRDADVRLLACELVRNQPDEEAANLICKLLDAETEANVCAAAIEVLAEVGGQSALPTLARCEERFKEIPFVVFSIRITADQIRSQLPPQRA